MSDPRADIPRERAYYPAGSIDPVRATSPYTPIAGNTGSMPHVPVVGLIVLGAIVLLFEHFRKGR